MLRRAARRRYVRARARRPLLGRAQRGPGGNADARRRTGRAAAGVGRALTQVCIERARADGRRRIVLDTGDWMAAAEHLYESLDFERERAIDFSPAPGIDLIGYAFDLAAEEP